MHACSPSIWTQKQEELEFGPSMNDKARFLSAKSQGLNHVFMLEEPVRGPGFDPALNSISNHVKVQCSSNQIALGFGSSVVSSSDCTFCFME